LAKRWQVAIDLPSILLRKAISGMTGDRARCASCRRTPVPGEMLHVYAGERRLCDLCVADSRGEPLRSERVHASERHLAVVPRAA